jgi:hypothetical protein
LNAAIVARTLRAYNKLGYKVSFIRVHFGKDVYTDF